MRRAIGAADKSEAVTVEVAPCIIGGRCLFVTNVWMIVTEG
jgi:hypothetical protein